MFFPSVYLDFSGRQEENAESLYNEVIIQDERANTAVKTVTYGRQKPPKFINHGSEKSADKNIKRSESSKTKIQYEEQEHSDPGLCLSMHQPWATLLVKGIKKTEGRSWYTSHRGRLWIASTSKQPSSETIKALETHYQETTGVSAFPTSYPTASLLGCVNIKDVVQETVSWLVVKF